ncbi:hypothetical protein [Streptomyces klenkii]|uniref:hypothetical protein n=1 Tax=Streptomyces klenkii TaxID=1420899 RepID=UPI0011C3E58F|nr:hypothetical protein [Streptomyces klenkii]
MRAQIIAVAAVICGLATINAAGTSTAQTTAPKTLNLAPAKCGAKLEDWFGVPMGASQNSVFYTDKKTNLRITKTSSTGGTLQFIMAPDAVKKASPGTAVPFTFKPAQLSWKEAGGKEAKLSSPSCGGKANATAVVSATLESAGMKATLQRK